MVGQKQTQINTSDLRVKLSDSIVAHVHLISKTEGVDPDLVKAIICKESAGNPWAVRYEPNWKYFTEVQNHALKTRISLDTERTCQAMSWGLMQIMGSVARELLYEGDLTKLLQEDLNIKYGAKKLRILLKKYAKPNDAIAAYNAGIPKFMTNGKYFNQPYVDGVNAFLNIIRGQK